MVKIPALPGNYGLGFRVSCAAGGNMLMLCHSHAGLCINRKSHEP